MAKESNPEGFLEVLKDAHFLSPQLFSSPTGVRSHNRDILLQILWERGCRLCQVLLLCAVILKPSLLQVLFEFQRLALG